MRFSVVLPYDDPATIACLRRQTHAALEVVRPGARVSGDVVAFLGPGALPEPTWLADLALAYADDQVMGVGGIVVPTAAEGVEHRIAVADRDNGVCVAVEPPLTPYVLPGADPHLVFHPANASFRRGVLNPQLDLIDLCRTLIDAGHRLMALEGARVYAPVASMVFPRVQADAAAPYQPLTMTGAKQNRMTVAVIARHGCDATAKTPVGRFARTLAESGHDVHWITEGYAATRVAFADPVWVHRVPAQRVGPWSAQALPERVADGLAWSATAHETVRELSQWGSLDFVLADATDCAGYFCHLDDELKTVAVVSHAMPTRVGWNAEQALDPATDYWTAMQRAILSHATEVIAPTEAALQRCLRALGLTRRGQALVTGECREVQLREPRDTIHIATIGALGAMAGTDLFLAATATLATEFPAAEFHLIGADPHGWNQRQFLAKHGEEPWAQRVHFHPADADHVLEQCDILCQAERVPPDAEALLQGMSYGLAIVQADSGGAAELLDDGVTGLIAYAGSVSSLTRHLRTLMADPKVRQRLGQAARLAYDLRFSANQQREAILARFEHVARAHAA